jgi:hypothetical protein
MNNNQITLDLYKGTENSLFINDVERVKSENGFLAECYENAQNDVINYLKQSDEIRKQLEDNKSFEVKQNDILYRAPRNIIVFSGKRGTGKTSTMLSFAYSLKNSLVELQNDQTDNKNLYNRGFLVLNPIDPTALESEQNILNVVLSRLMYSIQESWNHQHDPLKDYMENAEERDRLLKLASECLSGISAVKNGDKIDSLHKLQEIGDSAVLKTNLYKLIDDVNQYCLPEKYKKLNNVLVIPVDDTDCQIAKGYDVMEDIRRYLTLPNVLILMATDIDMLKQVFTQSFAESFKTNITIGMADKNEVSRTAGKYLSKMIPLANKIYLPQVDDMIRNGNNGILVRYFQSINDSTDILQNGMGFQSRILNLLFKKTHLFFSEHESYCNNIIPHTLRGLTYFLNMLSEMEDVPECYDIKNPDKSFYMQQTNILDKNIRVFEAYFLNEWVPVKLDNQMQKIILEISNQYMHNRIPYAFACLKRNFGMSLNPVIDIKPKYYDLDKMLRMLMGSYAPESNASFKDIKSPEIADYYSIFAIKVIIGILNERDIIYARKKILNQSNDDTSFSLIIDYDKNVAALPDSFYFNNDELPRIVSVKNNIDFKATNSTDDIGKVATKGLFEVLKGNFSPGLDKKEKCLQQEIAGIIACSWDAQDYIKKIVRKGNENDEFDINVDHLENSVPNFYHTVLTRLGAANDNMMKQMIDKSLPRKNRLNNLMRCDAVLVDLQALINKYSANQTENDLNKLVENLPKEIPTDHDEKEKLQTLLENITSCLRNSAKYGDEANKADQLANACESIDVENQDNDEFERKYKTFLKNIKSFNESLKIKK